MCAELTDLVEEIEFLEAEQRHLAAIGPRLKILHRFAKDGCCPGEEIALILLIYPSREFPLALPLSLRILLDYLARHRRLAQSAAQIEAGVRADDFCVKHGANAKTARRLTRKISQSAVKEYVKRIRRALQGAFTESGLNLDPFKVLVSEATEGNEVRYRLRASVEWIHLP